MKLNEIVAAVQRELRGIGYQGEYAYLSAAFTARELADGTVECQFVDRTAIPKPQPGEIHHLKFPIKLTVDEGGENAGKAQPVEGEPDIRSAPPIVVSGPGGHHIPPTEHSDAEPYPGMERDLRGGVGVVSRANQIGDPLLTGDPLDKPALFRRGKDVEEE